jgi:16S rRNA (uracil1498-N3)-methyltransferase
MIPIFYVRPDKIGEDHAIIDGPEARHARDVMRIRKGAAVIIVDGCGHGYRAEVIKVSRTGLECNLVNKTRHYGEPLRSVTLAAGLSAGFKFDEVIERATELGVGRLVPLLTEKSKVKVDNEERRKRKLNRWNKVALASMKQARRSVLPEISNPMLLRDFLESLPEDSPALMFDPNLAEFDLSKVSFGDNDKKVALIVGPESGFSREEVELGRRNGCRIVSLGKRILRTENASPSVLAVVMYLLGELR